MMNLPASKSLQLLIILLAAVILLLLGGAIWYKQSVNQVTQPINQVQQQETPVPAQGKVQLRLTPTTAGTYTVRIEGLTEPVNGISFQIIDPPGGVELTSSTFSPESILEQSGWSNAFNNSENTEAGKILSFSTLRSAPTETISETFSSIELGTLSFSKQENGLGNELSLAVDGSYVTYVTGNAAQLELIIE